MATLHQVLENLSYQIFYVIVMRLDVVVQDYFSKVLWFWTKGGNDFN